jgi:uracil-DNA glycosylase
MTERSTILREMGLTPIWALRTVAQIPDTAVDTANTARIAAVEESAAPVTAPAQPDPNREAAIAAMSWDELAASIASCTACKLSASRNKTVPGVGDRSPSWMVIGEAPGENEDKQGEPFVGKAGQLLDAMLAAVGKKRSHGVFIANVIKCRPPGNRNPEAEEIAACAPYLKRQITLASPKLLLATGKFAAQTLLNRDETVAALRGTGGEFQGIPVVVTYHPAYLLRSPLEKAKAWDDLMKAQAIVA